MLDPNLSAADLYHLAQNQPELLPQILHHPNCYPDLAEWIKQRTEIVETPAAASPAQASPTEVITPDALTEAPPTEVMAPAAAAQTINPVPDTATITPTVPTPVATAPATTAKPSLPVNQAPSPAANFVPNPLPQRINQPVATQQSTSGAVEKKRQTALIIILAVLVVAIIATLVGFWIWNRNNPKDSEPATPQSAQSNKSATGTEPGTDNNNNNAPSPSLDESIKRIDFGNFTSSQKTKDGLSEWDMQGNTNTHLQNQHGQVIFYPGDTAYVDLNDDNALDAVLFGVVCFKTSSDSTERACSPLVRTALWDREQHIPHFMPLLVNITHRGHLGETPTRARQEGHDIVGVVGDKLLVTLPFSGEDPSIGNKESAEVKVFKDYYYLPETGTAFPDLVSDAPAFKSKLASASKYQIKSAPFDDAPKVKVGITQLIPPEELGPEATVVNDYRKTIAFVDPSVCLEPFGEYSRVSCYYEVWVK